MSRRRDEPRTAQARGNTGRRRRRREERLQAQRSGHHDWDEWPGDPGEFMHYHPAGGVFIEEGWRMAQIVLHQTGGVADQWGPWLPQHAQGEPGGVGSGVSAQFAKVLAKTDQEVSVTPGQNMKDPDGGIIWPLVAQPASGEPARDPWTGELTGETEP